MRTIVESWRLDEMQDFEMTNKTQIELVDLGFEAKYTECRTLIRLFRPILVQMVLRAEKVKNGVAQSVRFVATCR
ncbi:hypothetical protein L596_001114 [Steinernema carpocapsae]|uniref:Uncharacterized protein n=1 Tax=Steinernema carpocapsae TaxID=34508 RepID=A0A4U8UKI3_STECR|nr:hypothetical protein L596_001114 [Steinernema carpocapsae]